MGAIGHEEIVAEVIQGKRVMTQEQTKTVSKIFKVDPSLFVRQDEID